MTVVGSTIWRIVAWGECRVDAEGQAMGWWPFGKKRRKQTAIGHVELPEHRGPTWRTLWERHVPERGQADTEQGELLRTTSRLSHEYSNNGCVNWDRTFDLFCEFVLARLRDGTFDDAVNAFVTDVLSSLLEFAHAGEDEETRMPAFEHVEYLECLAELWCLEHAEPMPRQKDPRLDF